MLTDDTIAQRSIRNTIAYAADMKLEQVQTWVIEDLEEAIRLVVRDELRSGMAAALADPDVTTEAKSLAGYLLQRLDETREN